MNRVKRQLLLRVVIAAVFMFFGAHAVLAQNAAPNEPTHDDAITGYAGRFNMDTFAVERHSCREAWQCDREPKTECCADYCDLTACTKAGTASGLTWGAVHAQCSPHRDKYTQCMRQARGDGEQNREKNADLVSSVTLELTFPAGQSPKVFARGWLFGARCSVMWKNTSTRTDCTDEVRWFGTGRFSPETGGRSRPEFNTPGPNEIVLSADLYGEHYEQKFAVTAVAQEGYAKVGDLMFCNDALAHGIKGPAYSLPGVVTTGSDLIRIGPNPAARKGDIGVVPQAAGDHAEIVSGDPDVLIEGRPAARIGDRVRCLAGFGAVGTPVPRAEPLPDPDQVLLEARRSKLPEPEALTLNANRPNLPEPRELSLQANRPRLPAPFEIALSARQGGFPEPFSLTLQATRPASNLIAVPPVLKKPLGKAVEEVATAGLSPAPALGKAPLKRDEIPMHVYATVPEVGAMLEPGEPVTLTAYGERPKRPVPATADMTPEAAAGVLREAGFDPVEPVLGDAAPEEPKVGRVQNTAPPGGSLREIFTPVQPILYGAVEDETAPETDGLRVVPPLAGLSLDAANAWLRRIGLVPGLPTLGKPAPVEIEPGTVSGSVPPAGDMVPEKTVVLPVVWGLHAADSPPVDTADLAPEPWEDDVPETPEDTEDTEDSYFQFPEPDFAEPQPERETASDTRPESGWAGVWEYKMSILPQKSAHVSGEFEIRDEPDGTFARSMHEIYRDKRYAVTLSGNSMRFTIPSLTGTKQTWEVQGSGGDYALRMSYVKNGRSVSWAGWCRRK